MGGEGRTKTNALHSDNSEVDFKILLGQILVFLVLVDVPVSPLDGDTIQLILICIVKSESGPVCE